MIFVPKEYDAGELRVPVIPDTVARLVKLGAEFLVESGAGQTAFHDDSAYEAAGATITSDRAAGAPARDASAIRGADSPRCS